MSYIIIALCLLWGWLTCRRTNYFSAPAFRFGPFYSRRRPSPTHPPASRECRASRASHPGDSIMPSAGDGRQTNHGAGPLWFTLNPNFLQ